MLPGIDRQPAPPPRAWRRIRKAAGDLVCSGLAAVFGLVLRDQLRTRAGPGERLELVKSKPTPQNR